MKNFKKRDWAIIVTGLIATAFAMGFLAGVEYTEQKQRNDIVIIRPR